MRVKEEEKEEEKEEDRKEEDKKEDRSHGLSVCPFDVLSPHCSPLGPLCTVNCTTHYTLCTVLPPDATTLHFKLYHTLYYTILICGVYKAANCTLHNAHIVHDVF